MSESSAMQVSVEKTSEIGRKLTVTIPEDRVNEEVDKQLNKVAKKATVKGFRPGKVPKKVLLSQFGKSTHAEAINELIKATLPEALEKEGSQPLGMPTVNFIKAEFGGPLEYIAEFEVFPEFTLVDLENSDIEKTIAEITDEDVEKNLYNMREQHTSWHEVDRSTQKGDQVIIDFEGMHNGKPLERGSAKDAKLILGSNSFIPGFEDGLIGSNVGDEKVLPLTFPDDYHEKDIAGQPVEFTVHIKKISEPKLPELNDEFAKAMNAKEGSIDELRKSVRDYMQHNLDKKIRYDFHEQVFEKLAQVNKITIPESLVKYEIEDIKRQVADQHEGLKAEKIQTTPDMEKAANRRTIYGLLAKKAVETYGLKSDEKRVHEELVSRSKVYQQPEELINWHYAEKERLSGVEAQVLEDQVIEKVLEQATITEKKSSYYDVMGFEPVKIEEPEAAEHSA